MHTIIILAKCEASIFALGIEKTKKKYAKIFIIL